jgi:hypothetical protein
MQTIFDETIPEVSWHLEVSAVDDSHSIGDIYRAIKAYAQDHEIDIHKIVFKQDENRVIEKNIFTFAASEKANYSYDEDLFKTKTRFYDSSALIAEHPRGTYAITQALPAGLIADFHRFGLSVTVEAFSMSDLLFRLLVNVLGVLSAILFLATIVACLFYKLSQSKKYGVWVLNGRSSFMLACRDYVVDAVAISFVFVFFTVTNIVFLSYYGALGVLLLVVLFLVNIGGTLLVSRLSTTVEQIKGKRNYGTLLYLNLALKVLVVIVTIVFFVNLRTTITTAQQVLNSLSKWESIGDYYELRFSPITDLVPDTGSSPDVMQRQARRGSEQMYPLIKQAEAHGAVLASTNEDVLDNEKQTNSARYLDNNPFMMVNHNFLHVVDVRDEANKRIERLPVDRFYIVIPTNEKAKTAQIKDEVVSIISLHKNLFVEQADEGPYEIDVLYTAPEQRLFNFNSEHPEQNESISPVLLVVSLEAIGNNLTYLLGEMSLGHYLIKDYAVSMHDLRVHHLTEQFNGLVSIKERGLERLEHVRNEYVMHIVALVVLLIVYLVIIFYTCVSYIETSKKKLFLQYIHGASFNARHKLFYVHIGSTSLVLCLIMALTNLVYVMPALIALVIECIVLTLTLVYTEHAMHLHILKKED